jgi:hypothetical protein
VRARKKDSTAYPVPFFVTSTADHITGKTGLTPVITISKNGTTALSAASGAITEIGSGWYAWAGSSADRNTLGALVAHVSSSANDPADFSIDILAIDPFDANLSLTNLDAAVSSRAASGVSVTVSSPTASDGTITVITGDDYFSADSASIDFSYSGVADLTGSTVKLSFQRDALSTPDLTVTGSVLTSASLRFQPTSTQTGLLVAGEPYHYDVQATLTNGHVRTLSRATATILSDFTT